MEFIRRAVVDTQITDIKQGSHQYMNLDSYSDVEPIADQFLYQELLAKKKDKLWNDDGKIERYAIFNVLLERCMDRVLAKGQQRQPLGLIVEADNGFTTVQQSDLQSANDLRIAMITTFKEDTYEETAVLRQIALSNPDAPISRAWKQYEKYINIFNATQPPNEQHPPEDFLLEGANTGIEHMSFMVATVPALFNSESFRQKYPDAQVSPLIYSKTLQYSLSRDIPIPSSDGISFDYINANTVDMQNNSYLLDKVHLEPYTDAWAVVFNEEVLSERKSRVKTAVQDKTAPLTKDSKVISCPANHTEIPLPEQHLLSTMEKMEQWVVQVGSKMYEEGYGQR